MIQKKVLGLTLMGCSLFQSPVSFSDTGSWPSESEIRPTEIVFSPRSYYGFSDVRGLIGSLFETQKTEEFEWLSLSQPWVSGLKCGDSSREEFSIHTSPFKLDEGKFIKIAFP